MKTFSTIVLIFLAIPFILLADFEPDNKSFIATKGMNDPATLNSSEVNGKNTVMQIRTSSIESSVTLKKIVINVKISENTIYFGDGIKSISLYFDSDENGDSDGEQLIKAITFSEKTTTVEFADLDIQYDTGESKHLLIDLDMAMKDLQTIQIMIPEDGIEISDPDINVLGLPIQSKAIKYKCSEDPECTENNDNSNCRDGIVDEGELCDSSVKPCIEINSDKYISGEAFCDYNCNHWNDVGCELNENYNPDGIDVDGCSITVL